MIWPSRICSRYKAAGAFRYWPACLILAAALQAGSVHGRFQIVSSQDPEVRKHSDYSGVVVWLEPASGAPPAPLPPHRKVEMVKRRRRSAGGGLQPYDDSRIIGVFTNLGILRRNDLESSVHTSGLERGGQNETRWPISKGARCLVSRTDTRRPDHNDCSADFQCQYT